MENWLNQLDAMGLTWVMMSFIAFITMLMIVFSLQFSKAGRKTNLKGARLYGFLVAVGILVAGIFWFTHLLEYKRKFEEGSLIEVVNMRHQGKDYLITFCESVTTTKSSTTRWLPFDILEAETGKRVKRKIVKLGNVSDVKIVGWTAEFVWVYQQGLKLLDIFGKEAFLTDAEIQALIESKMPDLKGKIGKIVLRETGIFEVTTQSGDAHCIRQKDWQKTDCQAQNDIRKSLHNNNSHRQIFLYFDYTAHYWRDSTWLVLALPNKKSPAKSRLYQYKGEPQYGRISVTYTEGDSTRNLLPDKPKTQLLSFPQMLKPLDSTVFLNANLLFCTTELALLKNTNAIGVGSKTLLTAYNPTAKSTTWQIATDSLQLYGAHEGNFQVIPFNQGKRLLLFVRRPYPAQGKYKVVCLNADTGHTHWKYDFK